MVWGSVFPWLIMRSWGSVHRCIGGLGLESMEDIRECPAGALARRDGLTKCQQLAFLIFQSLKWGNKEHYDRLTVCIHASTSKVLVLIIHYILLNWYNVAVFKYLFLFCNACKQCMQVALCTGWSVEPWRPTPQQQWQQYRTVDKMYMVSQCLRGWGVGTLTEHTLSWQPMRLHVTCLNNILECYINTHQVDPLWLWTLAHSSVFPHSTAQ